MSEITKLDATGLLCPLPVLKLRKRLRAVSEGEKIEIIADDPAAVIDIPHFCNESGHELLSMTEDDTHQIYLIRKSSAI